MEANYKLNVFILCIFIITITIPATVRANIADFDAHWQGRAKEAKQAANEAYNKNPAQVTESFNKEVHDTFDAANKTRRNLKQKYKGPCLATNPSLVQCRIPHQAHPGRPYSLVKAGYPLQALLVDLVEGQRQMHTRI